TNAVSRSDDALSLPLVAYRGLWDKFGKPLSDEAIRRSYLRGVPSLIRCEESAVGKILELVRNSTAGCRTASVYLLVHGLPPMVTRPVVDAAIDLFTVDFDRARVSTIYRWLNDEWTPVGCYIPLAASVQELTAADLTLERDQ